jgi:hypothetical protein
VVFLIYENTKEYFDFTVADLVLPLGNAADNCAFSGANCIYFERNLVSVFL